MKNLNKSSVLTSIESINQTLKKVEKIIQKIWIQNVPSSITLGLFLFYNPRVKNDIMSVEYAGCSASPLMRNTVDSVDQVKELLLQTKESLLIKL